MKNYVKQGWLVVILALGFGAALAGVNVALNPIIEQNQKNETYEQIPVLVLGTLVDGITKKDMKIVGNAITISKAGETVADLKIRRKLIETADSEYTVYCVTGSPRGGWVITAEGMGFADKIKALVGLDTEAKKITGVYVLEQKETPGLGNKIVGPWSRQYSGQPADKPLKVEKRMSKEDMDAKDGAIDAISGATITSDALTTIVNGAVEQFRADLKAGKTNANEKSEEKK
ncbi:MAG: FMN-binding protein [Phycisphaerae bacterium]|nr:FMN-binding protein [Phycisphaerae bacterium]